MNQMSAITEGNQTTMTHRNKWHQLKKTGELVRNLTPTRNIKVFFFCVWVVGRGEAAEWTIKVDHRTLRQWSCPSTNDTATNTSHAKSLYWLRRTTSGSFHAKKEQAVEQEKFYNSIFKLFTDCKTTELAASIKNDMTTGSYITHIKHFEE
jgi:hypothetical protein